MQVREIMTYNAESIDADSNLVEASRKMRSLEVGALPVWHEGELAGMITDRDITTRATAEGKDPITTHVKEIMTREVCFCYEDDDIHEAAEMMENKSIHRHSRHTKCSHERAWTHHGYDLNAARSGQIHQVKTRI